MADEISMVAFGHLVSVRRDTSPRPGFVQLLFDTNVEMFIPNSLFDSLDMRFTLQEKDHG